MLALKEIKEAIGKSNVSTKGTIKKKEQDLSADKLAPLKKLYSILQVSLSILLTINMHYQGTKYGENSK